ncbi:hypothetical protein [Duganella sp. HH105]|uniref:hypothetical protein n=1 Tax=Duganella sp. HH105 TaxID=1781067 RepID=UPI00114CE87B|nr:hypothetical protein [Duganella sp. HH105]
MMDFLNWESLAQSYALGEITSVTLFAVGEVFEVRLATAKGVSKLMDDGACRVFSDLREALSLLRKLGIQQVAVDVSGWRAADSEADHADWAKNKIGAAMAGLKDGSNRVFSAEEWAAVRAAKKSSRGAL